MINIITSLYNEKYLKGDKIKIIERKDGIKQIKINSLQVNFRQLRLVGAEKIESSTGRYEINVIEVLDSEWSVTLKVLKDNFLHSTCVHVYVGEVCSMFGIFDTGNNIETMNLYMSDSVDEIYLSVIDQEGRWFITEQGKEVYKAVIDKTMHMRIVK